MNFKHLTENYFLEPCLKTVAQKMLDNHINSHQEGELKSIFEKLNRALLRPKSRNTSRSKYNRRIKKTQERLGILSKLLGIPETNSDAASSDGFNPDGFDPDAVNPGSVQSDATNSDAVNPDAVQPDWTNPALESIH